MITNEATQLLGSRIRDARQERRVSLRAVAQDAAISASMLSQIENGKVLPSVQTLWSIVSILGISVDDVLAPANKAEKDAEQAPAVHRILGGRPHPPVLVRAESTPATRLESGVTWRPIAVAHRDAVEAMATIYPPGTASSEDGRLHEHNGTEYGYVTRGELELQVEFTTYRLHAGDSFSFDSARPHRFANVTGEDAEAIWYILSPNLTTVADSKLTGVSDARS